MRPVYDEELAERMQDIARGQGVSLGDAAALIGVEVEERRHPAFRVMPGSSPCGGPELIALNRKLSGEYDAAKAALLTNVRVLGSGFVLLTEEAFVTESLFLHRDMAPRIRNSLRDRPKTLSDEYVYIIADNCSSIGNYWHWFAQSIPAILHCIDLVRASGRKKIALLVGDLTKWQIDSLEYMGLGDIPREAISLFTSAIVPVAAYSTLLSSGQVFSDNRYRVAVRDAMLRASFWRATSSIAAKNSSKILISRKDTKKRRLLNETSLHEELISHGFVAIEGSQITMADQVAIAGHADIIVAPHGAGSTNVLFGKEGARYVELAQSSYVNGGPISLSKTSGMIPTIDIYPHSPGGESGDTWSVDIDLVLETVKSALIYRSST